MQIVALFIIAITVFLIVKRYQTHATLFISGFALLSTAHLSQTWSGEAGIEESITGLFAFDLFAMVSEAFSTRVARIGMIIMAAGGFAKYMSAISASRALVSVSTKKSVAAISLVPLVEAATIVPARANTAAG